MQEKKYSKKKLIIGILLIIVLGGSSTLAYMFTIPHQVTESLSNTDQTKLVNDVFSTMPVQCYIIYANPQFKGDQSMKIQIYNDTKNALLNDFGAKIYDFLSLPATKLYLFNHCRYFDNMNQTIPNKYDPTLGTINATSQNIEFEKMRQEMQVKYDFVTQAKGETKIENLANFYLLSYDEVVGKLFNDNLISEKTDCHGIPHSSKGTLQCQWKQSVFEFNNVTGYVVPLPDSLLQKTNSTQ